jgi:hypothetical protein
VRCWTPWSQSTGSLLISTASLPL